MRRHADGAAAPSRRTSIARPSTCRLPAATPRLRSRSAALVRGGFDRLAPRETRSTAPERLIDILSSQSVPLGTTTPAPVPGTARSEDNVHRIICPMCCAVPVGANRRCDADAQASPVRPSARRRRVAHGKRTTPAAEMAGHHAVCRVSRGAGPDPDGVFWFENGRPHRRGGRVQALGRPTNRGWTPLISMLRRWLALAAVSGGRSALAADWAAFDTAVSVAVARYLSSVHQGRVDPRVVGFDYDLTARRSTAQGVTVSPARQEGCLPRSDA